MLHPCFLQAPPDTEIPEDKKFWVVSYAIAAEYTLIRWNIGDSENAYGGESLYKGYRLIVSEGGQIPLWEPTETIQGSTPDGPLSTFELIPSTVGLYGVPPSISKRLRATENQTYFQVAN
jgi:hypothetical protein